MLGKPILHNYVESHPVQRAGFFHWGEAPQAKQAMQFCETKMAPGRLRIRYGTACYPSGIVVDQASTRAVISTASPHFTGTSCARPCIYLLLQATMGVTDLSCSALKS